MIQRPNKQTKKKKKKKKKRKKETTSLASASFLIFVCSMISLILAQISRADFCPFFISLYRSLYAVVISGEETSVSYPETLVLQYSRYGTVHRGTSRPSSAARQVRRAPDLFSCDLARYRPYHMFHFDRF